MPNPNVIILLSLLRIKKTRQRSQCCSKLFCWKEEAHLGSPEDLLRAVAGPSEVESERRTLRCRWLGLRSPAGIPSVRGVFVLALFGALLSPVAGAPPVEGSLT